MTKLSRIEEVEAIIRRKRRMAIKELEQLTYSSASTLRRDLIYLEEHGLIRRARGEVFLNSSNTNEESYFLRENKNKNAKKKIATLSRDFIGPGMCIYLDASTTVFELCPYVCEVNHLIILTNDLKSAQYLAEHTNPSNKIFEIGGEVRHHSTTSICQDFEHSFIQQFNIDLAICSASGIDDRFVYEKSLNQALAKKNIIEKAKNTILLVDQTKFFHTGFYKINQLSAYKTIISDAAPDPKMLVAAEDCGTEWIY